MENDPETTKAKSIVWFIFLSIIFLLIFAVFYLPRIIYDTTHPEEVARTKIIQEQIKKIDENNMRMQKENAEQQERLKRASQIVVDAGVFTYERAEEAYKKGNYEEALDVSDIVLSSQPDSTTVFKIASLCGKIADTGPTGNVATKLYKVSDKGQRLIESRTKNK